MRDPLRPPIRDPNARKNAQNHFGAAKADTSLAKQMHKSKRALYQIIFCFLIFLLQ